MPKFRVTRHTVRADGSPFTMDKVIAADTQEAVDALPADTVEPAEDATPEYGWRVIEPAP